LGRLGRLRAVEVFLRVAILVTLSMAAVVRNSLSPSEGMLLFFGLLVVWDLVVLLGGQGRLARFFMKFDGPGMLISGGLVFLTSTQGQRIAVKAGIDLGFAEFVAVAIMFTFVVVGATVSFLNMRNDAWPKPDAFEVVPNAARRKLIFWLIVVFLAAALFLVFLLTSSRTSRDSRVTIGIATWPGFASGMVGKEKQFFDGINLRYRIIDDLPARDAAFRSGQVDVLSTSVDLWVQEYSQGLKGKIVIVSDESAGGDGIVVKPEIKDASDLRGRKVAFARATPSHYLLFKVLEKAKLTPEDIQQVKMEDPGAAGQAFLGDRVDAAVTWEPFLTQVRESTKGTVLATSKDFPETIVDVLVASPKLLDQPDLLRRFAQGWLKSVDYIKSHPEESAQIIAKGLKVKTEDAQGMMAGLQFADAARNRYFFSSLGSSGNSPIAKVIGDAGAFWKQQGIITTVPSSPDISSGILVEVAPSPSTSGR
jgi:NitT/TauT family transport system substrate-binding protein